MASAAASNAPTQIGRRREPPTSCSTITCRAGASPPPGARRTSATRISTASAACMRASFHQGQSCPRSRARPLCSRVFTAATLVPVQAATSAWLSPAR